MLTPPDDLSEPALLRVLADSWDLDVASLEYRPLGFGSHHWQAVDTRGELWFVTVDDLETKRRSTNDTTDAACKRLHAALATAQDLNASGCEFVVAPVPTFARTPLALLDQRFAVALYPFVEGTSNPRGEFTESDRRGVLDLIVALHSVPVAAAPEAPVDDFAIPRRGELEASLEPGGLVWESGPYTERCAKLLVDSATEITRNLVEFDNLVRTVQDLRPADRIVFTHGEPHPGNTIRRSDHWLLVDWDTALLAPPERDLWSLDCGDGAVLRAYTSATDTALFPPALELYRLRWDLADLAEYVSHFRRRHFGSADDDKSWHEIREVVDRLPTA